MRSEESQDQPRIMHPSTDSKLYQRLPMSRLVRTLSFLCHGSLGWHFRYITLLQYQQLVILTLTLALTLTLTLTLTLPLTLTTPTPTPTLALALGTALCHAWTPSSLRYLVQSSGHATPARRGFDARGAEPES